MRTIKNFALWSAVFSLMPNPKCGPFNLKSLWQDSLRRGLFARTIGKMLGVKDLEDLFTAALLQDMAVPLLAKEMPQDYLKLLEQRDGGKVRLSDLEQEQFGWTHAQAAGMMARGWSLPEEVAILIEAHIDIDLNNLEGDSAPRKLAVGLSTLLPASTDKAWSERPRFDADFSKLFGDDGPTVSKILDQTDHEFTDIAPFLKLGIPNKSLVDTYNEFKPVSAL